jgi:hypothetical protein
VLAEHDARHRKLPEQAVIHHVPGAAAQGVEVSAQHHHGTVAVPQQTDHPCAAHLLGDLEAQRPQREGDSPGGALLLQ